MNISSDQIAYDLENTDFTQSHATSAATRQSFSTGETDPDNLSTERDGLRPDRILQMLFRKYKILTICILLMMSFNSIKAIRAKPSFKSSFRILVEPIQRNNQLNKITDEEKSTAEFDYSSQIEVLLSPKVLVPVTENIGGTSEGISYSSLVEKLSIIRLGETKLIEVNYSSNNPLEVEQVLNALAEAYLQYSLDEQRELSHRGLKFINQQMPQIRAQSDQLQQELQSMRQRYGFMDPELYAREVQEQMSQAAEQIQGLQSNLLALEERYRSLSGLAQSTILSQSSAYQEHLSEYQVLERQIAIETGRYGENHPTIQLYRRQQKNLLPLLQKEAKRAIGNQLAGVASDISVTRTQRDALQKIEADLAQQLNRIPAISRRYNELQSQISVVNDSLKRLLETKEALEIAASQSEIPWQLVKDVEPPQSQLGTSLSKALIMGFMSGGILGAVLIYSIEKMENSFYTIEDVQEEVPIPLIGTIPLRKDLKKAGSNLHQVDFWQQKRIHDLTLMQVQDRDQHTVLDIPSLESGISLLNPEDIIGDWGMFWSPDQAYKFIESFRTLQVILNHRKTGNSITISSAMAGEGKTTIAVFLAQSAAAMGQKVLLVDAHLRTSQGCVHDFLSITPAPGLSDYLLGSKPIEDYIRPIVWEPMLSILTVGSITTDPSRLLSLKKMKGMIQEMDKKFDLVIYNVPSLNSLPDARIIAKETQQLLIVVQMERWGAKRNFKIMEERLHAASIPISGIILNETKCGEASGFKRESF